MNSDLKNIEFLTDGSITYIADLDCEKGKKYEVVVGKKYNGVSRKRKTVKAFFKEDGDVYVLYKSNGNYYCESIQSFCYQVHLVRQSEKAAREYRKQEKK